MILKSWVVGVCKEDELSCLGDPGHNTPDRCAVEILAELLQISACLRAKKVENVED